MRFKTSILHQVNFNINSSLTLYSEMLEIDDKHIPFNLISRDKMS